MEPVADLVGERFTRRTGGMPVPALVSRDPVDDARALTAERSGVDPWGRRFGPTGLRLGQ